jgi:hypothetical protein
MTHDPCTLYPVEKARKANFGTAVDPMSAHSPVLDQIRRCNVWCFVIRAAVTVVSRHVGFNDFYIRKQRLDSTKSVN